MKGKSELVIPLVIPQVIYQILVFALFQHIMSSLHSLVIYSIDVNVVKTLWQVLSAPTIHDSIG